ncbi:hypothetical protein SAMN05660350_02159 [Geodermatophilus obscurus]|uniref:Uncharacterized protein n=1 Tax=Geodermatophilus obscurus TaxID=1861 RepID=A0A1M7TTR5_9ACTN|nr:hypothetical protein [Geodermatophilus obscurus]SHN74101.1 hypothetical protein SAMN05660350_02159 [Geodermatophilus obscurus]
MSTSGVRVVTGRAGVVRELCAAGPLLAALHAPVTARAPWLTAALALDAARVAGPRPVAVVVDPPGGTHTPQALATLVLRGSLRLTATLLGDGLPVPAGAAPARLPARDDAAAQRLAAGVLDLLDRVRRPWTLRLAGLPLGDPTLRAIGRLRPEAAFASARTARLVDTLDEAGPVHRTRDPAEVERRLPALLAAEPDRRVRTALRVATRLHAAIGEVELATVADGDRLRAGLLTLVDGTDRRPWWSTPDSGLRTEMGAPLVSLTLRGGGPMALLRRP